MAAGELVICSSADLADLGDGVRFEVDRLRSAPRHPGPPDPRSSKLRVLQQPSGQLVDTFHASSNISNSPRIRQAGTPGNARAARAAASEASSFPRTEDGRISVQPHAGTCASGRAWPDRG